jgi:CBS domain-containing protein
MPERLNRRAEEIMSKDVLTVAPDTPVADVVRLLAERQASCAVVVSDDGRPEGIVSERDVLSLARTSDDRVAQVLRRMLQEEHHFFDSMRELRKAAATRVGDIASKPVVCAEAGMTVRQVAGLMERFDYRQVPVLRNGKVAGIVTRQEIVRAIADQA